MALAYEMDMLDFDHAVAALVAAPFVTSVRIVGVPAERVPTHLMDGRHKRRFLDQSVALTLEGSARDEVLELFLRRGSGVHAVGFYDDCGTALLTGEDWGDGSTPVYAFGELVPFAQRLAAEHVVSGTIVDV